MEKTTNEKVQLVCKYCNKQFSRESSFFVHVCEQKKRFSEKNEPGVRLGLQAFLRFFSETQTLGKAKTFDDFVKSTYYRAFTKFGRHIVAINAVNPSRFIDWIIKQNKKIDYWCHEKLYSDYLSQYLQTEAVTDALERAIQYSIKWGEEYGHSDCDVFRLGNTNRVCYAIQTGRISAWVIYGSVSGRTFINNLNEDNLAQIWTQVNPEFWQKKFNDYAEDYLYVQDILEKAGW